MGRTALELSPQEWKAYRPGHTYQETPEIAARKERGWKLAREAAGLLIEKFGAKRVVVFGSLAQDTGFTRWSDIDLAAWGIPPERYYAAVAAVTGLSAEFKVDLIDPDSCRSSLKDVIVRDGVAW
jgi:predicted nucleotidyltransferase